MSASAPPGPLLTVREHSALLAARAAASTELLASFDLGRSTESVGVTADAWTWRGRAYPYPAECRDRTVLHWTGTAFEPVARYGTALVKLVPTEWGPPTFEIDGVKMLPTAKVSPYEDARRKVELVRPRGARVLDTCGGLGYFAAWCLHGGAAHVASWERNPDVMWLRSLNPWSPDSPWSEAPVDRLALANADVSTGVGALPDASFDAVLHDPPRFGLAGELYSARFYAELARVLVRGGRMFHYVGTPNRLTTGRDVPREVAKRLEGVGFDVKPALDGLLAVKRARR